MKTYNHTGRDKSAARRWSRTTNRKPIASLIAVAALMALVATGCTTGGTGSATTSGHSKSTDTIRTVFDADPKTFAAYEADSVDDQVVSQLLYDTLVKRGEGNKTIDGLASDWKVDPTSGTFTIAKGRTCSDGTPITPAVVAKSLRFFADPKAGSRFTKLVFGPGPAKISANKAAGTVTIDLAQPWTDLLHGLALPVTGIVCPAGLKDTKGLAAGKVAGAYSGPYTLAQKNYGVRYEFDLRDTYQGWAKYEKPLEGVPAKHLVYTVSGDSSSAANELLTGSMDIATLRGNAIKRFKDNAEFNTEQIPAASLFLIFNERPGHPFADSEKRRAVAEAVNQVAFNQAATGGLGETFASFARPSVPCALTNKSALIQEDPSAATKVLKGVKIRIIGSQAFGPNGAANTYVAAALREAGANVKLRNVDNATWVTDATQKPETWDLTVNGQINAAGTMYGALTFITGPATEDGGANMTGNTHSKVLDLVAQAMTQNDADERCATYKQAQDLMIKQAHVVPLSSLAAQITARNAFSMRAIDGYRIATTMRITK